MPNTVANASSQSPSLCSTIRRSSPRIPPSPPFDSPPPFRYIALVLPALVQTLPRSDKANLLAIVLGVGMAFFLAIEPTQEWLLLVFAGLAPLGVGGVLRSHP